MPDSSRPNTEVRSAYNVADEIRTLVLEQGSVARMLDAVFTVTADTQPSERWFVPHMWEGLAVLEKQRQRDCERISGLIDELQQLTVGGAR
jgi:hypothetical protein